MCPAAVAASCSIGDVAAVARGVVVAELDVAQRLRLEDRRRQDARTVLLAAQQDTPRTTGHLAISSAKIRS